MGIKIRDIRQKCELTQEELAQVNFRTVPVSEGKFNAMWDEKNAEPKEIVFTELELLLIRDQLIDMNKKEQLPIGDRQFVKLYEQFTKEN